MTTPKKFVFVLMPFDEGFSDIYTFGIKQTCTELNIYCERVDEQIFQERILDRIYNQIARADIVVADMSNRNANVFYEVGYAHALGKNVILLTQNADDIPFDLKHFPHIIYDKKIKLLSDSLKTRLDWFLNKETKKEIENFDFALEFLIEGQKINSGFEIIIPRTISSTYHQMFDLKIDIYNSSAKTHKSKFKIGLEIITKDDEIIYGLDVVKPSLETRLFMSKEISSIYPNSYKSIDFKLKRNRLYEKDTPFGIKLKIFTSLEVRDIDFIIGLPTEKKINLSGWENF